ncbi:MAG: helix-turn-helix domain-containing protein [Planctomycetota bacterium]|jgi:hypothetical protein
MANQLKMADQKAIQALYRHGWSQRQIARQLGFHRDTISRYVKLARGEPHPGATEPGQDSKWAISITGPEPSKPAISITGSPGRQSLCEPFR